MEISMNQEKNGIEIRFDGKPAAEILASLKNNGFRWSMKQKMWYAKQNDKTVAFVNSLSGTEIPSATDFANQAEIYDLFAMTRTDTIGVQEQNAHNTDTVKIAAMIRSHIKSRFKMCKFSVRSTYNSIDVDLLSSPFAKDSEELKAIVHYIYVYAQSYNYDNSDSMSDYFDVGFYGVYESSIVSYSYQQTEMTVSEKNISDLFQTRKAENDVAKEAKQKADWEVYKSQVEAERAAQAIAQAEEQKCIAEIESSVKVVDCEPFFIQGMREPHLNKMNNFDDVVAECNEEGKHTETVCQITRKVLMDKATWNLFKDMLLSDFSFLAGLGGSATDDYRVSSMLDYQRMTQEERETVEWYVCNSVAVYVDDELCCVVNPEGHSYARYVLTAIDPITISDSYACKQAITKEEYEEYKFQADSLMDASTDIICENNFGTDWNKKHYQKWIRCMVRYIEESNINFNVNVIRAVGFTEDCFKTALYDALDEMNHICHQFGKAAIRPGQRVTLIRISDFGMMNINQVTMWNVEYGRYAQYDRAVKLTYRNKGERSDCCEWRHNDMLVYDGWVELPKNVLWEVVKDNAEVTMVHSRFLSCDRKQYVAIKEYFYSVGIYPIVDSTSK